MQVSCGCTRPNSYSHSLGLIYASPASPRCLYALLNTFAHTDAHSHNLCECGNTQSRLHKSLFSGCGGVCLCVHVFGSLQVAVVTPYILGPVEFSTAFRFPFAFHALSLTTWRLPDVCQLLTHTQYSPAVNSPMCGQPLIKNSCVVALAPKHLCMPELNCKRVRHTQDGGDGFATDVTVFGRRGGVVVVVILSFA